MPELTRRSSRDHAVAIREDVERVHLRAPHRHLHLHAAPRELVGTLAADLHRRGGRDRQLDLAAEALEPLLELLGCRRVVLLDDVALRVAGRRRRAERSIVRDVPLVQADEALRSLVARPEQTSSNPVANGSSVPA